MHHGLAIGYDDRPSVRNRNKLVKSPNGIRAWIGSPTVDLTDIDSNSIPYRSLRFGIPLLGGWYDFVEAGEKGRLYFGDWKMSWVASLGRRDIQQLEEGEPTILPRPDVH